MGGWGGGGGGCKAWGTRRGQERRRKPAAPLVPTGRRLRAYHRPCCRGWSRASVLQRRPRRHPGLARSNWLSAEHARDQVTGVGDVAERVRSFREGASGHGVSTSLPPRIHPVVLGRRRSPRWPGRVRRCAAARARLIRCPRCGRRRLEGPQRRCQQDRRS
jgi:hypothetical protein